jgi:hypothetical protein
MDPRQAGDLDLAQFDADTGTTDPALADLGSTAPTFVSK